MGMVVSDRSCFCLCVKEDLHEQRCLTLYKTKTIENVAENATEISNSAPLEELFNIVLLLFKQIFFNVSDMFFSLI